MKFLPGRFVELTHYSAQDFESMVPGPVTLFSGETNVGGVTLINNRFVDAENWAANDFESLVIPDAPTGIGDLPDFVWTDISGSGTHSAGGNVRLNSPSRFV